MESNPTTPITPEEMAEGTGIEYVEASRGTRFANLLIDAISYYFLMFLNGVILGLIGYIPDEDSFFWNIFAYIVIFIYYFLFEVTTNKTVGKFITKTIVVTYDNEKPTATTILWRTLSRFIPFDALSFFGERGWHDSISKTKVVKLQSKKDNI